MLHCDHPACTSHMRKAPMLTLLVLCILCGGPLFSAGQRNDFNVVPPPYDTPVQDLLAPILAFSIGPMGGPSYRSSATDAATVCATVDRTALTAPITVTTVDGLYRNVSGVTGVLDAAHACYLDTAQSPPQCTAALTSTAADCGGVAGGAVGPLLNASTTGVASSSAAVLAAYVRGGAAQRLKLERSLRRTRETVTALNRVYDLVQNANSTIADPTELSLLLRKATQYVVTLTNAAYARAVEKYYVLDAWTNASLGINAQRLSDFVSPAAQECGVYSYTRRLLWGSEASSTVLLDLMQATLALADTIHTKAYSPAVRGVQCAAILSGLAVMTLEDDTVRQLASKVAQGSLNSTSTWAVADFDFLLSNRTSALRQRQLWSLAYVFAAIADAAVVDDLVGGASVAECLRRAALVVPDSATGTVPPSIYWCFANASISAMPSTAVATRALAVRESATAANGQCLWGFSVWDGQCDGAPFNAAHCESCPPGSLGDGEGHCVCGNSTTSYATLTGGCLSKGPAHDVAGIRLLQADENVTLSGNASVALLSVQLPQTASLADPSAFLRIEVTCDDGGRGGGTRLLATPKGSRSAACASVVAYERHAERTGEWATFNGTQYFETYAENLTLFVTGTAAFQSETCTVAVTVQSALRQASRSVAAGSWTFWPSAEAFTLLTYSYTGTLSSDASFAPNAVPLCSQYAAASIGAGNSARSLVHVGVCRTSSGGPAVFLQPRAYAVFGSATLRTISQRIRSSAGGSRDAAFIEAVRSLANRTSLELTLEDGTEAAPLWTRAWRANQTPLATQAWAVGFVAPVNATLLRRMRVVRLRVVDAVNGSAFAAFEAAGGCRYGNDADGDSSSDDSAGGGGSGNGSAPRKYYEIWYVILIAIVSVLDAFTLVAFAVLLYLRHTAYETWPNLFK